MIDYHCHLLPALDDGPESSDESLEMARALADFGFREVHCTPHCITGHYEFSPVEVRAATGRLQAELDRAGIALRLHSGMEYYLDEGFERFAANLLPLGETRLVLCEAPPQALPGVVAAMLELIVVQGFIPLIAHPERSETIWTMLEEGWQPAPDEPSAPLANQPSPWWRRWFAPRSPAATSPAARDSTPGTQYAALPPMPPELPDSCLYQANLGSFAGFYGAKPQRRAYELLQRKIYHCVASDLHDARSLPACLEPAREKLLYNPALQKLGDFVAPRGAGGSPQMAFW
jgi:protein-tyrosine phosphatase